MYMALIKCKECGREISDKATACIHCGCPVNSSHNPSEEQYKPSKKKRWLVVGLAGVAVVAFAAAFLHKSMFEGGNDGQTSIFGNDEAVEVVVTQEFAEAVRQYDQLEPFSDGMAAVGKNGKWGYINHKGEEVIPCQFDSEAEEGEGGELNFGKSYCVSHRFSEGVAVVRLNEKWGVINKKGNVIVEYGRYEYIDDCHDGLLYVHSDNKSFFLNTKGDVAIDASEYGSALPFSDGFCRVCKNDKFGYIDTNGVLVIPCQYSSARSFSEGKAIVNFSDGGYTCIDKQGNELYHRKGLNVEFTSGEYHDGLMDVYDSNSRYYYKCGYVNENGDIVIPCQYNSYDGFDNGVYSFNDGFSYIYMNPNDGDATPIFIDKQGGKHTFPYKPLEGNMGEHKVFSEGMACVVSDERVGFIDSTGKLAIPFKYSICYDEHYTWSDGYGVFYNGVALVQMGDKWGYVDKNGNDTFTQDDADAYADKIKAQAEEDQKARERAEEQRRLANQNESSSMSNSSDGDDDYSQYSTDEGRSAYLEVLRLQKAARRLIDESAPYRNIMKSEVYGSYNYQVARMRNIDILKEAIANQERALNIAKSKLHDESLIRELSGQLKLLEQARNSD